MSTFLGNAVPNGKGAWSISLSYKKNDIVSYNGSSYLAMSDVPAGNYPVNTTYWMISGSKGDQATGIPPVSSAVSGNFPALDSSGNLNDSGKKPSDFFTTAPDATFSATDNKWGKIASYVSPMAVGLNGQICDAFRVLTRSSNGISSGFGIFSIDIRNSGSLSYVCVLKTQIPLPQYVEVAALVTANETNLTVDVYMRITTSPVTAVVYSLGSYLASGTFAKTYMGSVTPSYTDLPAATATISPTMQTPAYSSLTLLNSYTGWIRYSQSSTNHITARFSITPGTVTAGTQIGLFPSGSRPGMNCVFQLRNNTAGTVTNFYIASTGYVYNIDALTAGVNYSGSYTYLAE